MVIPLSFPFLLLFTGALYLVLFISSQSFYLADGRSQILTSSLEFGLEEKVYLYSTIALTEELENFIGNFQYTFELEGKYIFPNNTIKKDIIGEYKPAEYRIANLNYELMGFNITASDIKIHVSPTKLDNVKTRIDIPLLLAKNVKISNGGLINLSYNEVDLGSVYGIYEKNSDKIRVHVPITVAAKYVQ
jgi:hypothetical protein